MFPSRLQTVLRCRIRMAAILAVCTLAVHSGLSTATAADSESAVRSFSRAVTAWIDGDYAETDRLLSELIADESTDPRVYYFRGLARYAQGRHDAAAVDFEAGAQLEIERPSGIDINRSLERAQGPARRLLEKYRRQARRTADLQAGFYRGDRARQQLYAMARSAYFRNDFATTVELLDRVIADKSTDPRVYYFRGLALQQLGRPEDAQADFVRAVSLETAPGNQINVDRALERVQGPARRALEQHRSTALFAMRQRAAEERQQMIASILEQRLNAGSVSGANATAQPALTQPPGTTVAATGTGSPAAAPGNPAAANPATAGNPAAAAISTAWLDPATELLIHIRVADIWNSPLIRQFHDSQDLKAFVTEIEAASGLTPAGIASVTVGLSSVGELVGTASAAQLGGPAALNAGQEAISQARDNVIVVLRTRYPFDTAPIDALPEMFEKSAHNGKPYYRSLDPEQGPSIYVADLNTIVLADEVLLQEAMERGGEAEPRPEFLFVDPAMQFSLAFAPADPFALTEAIPDDGGTGSPGMDALAAAIKGQTLAVGLGIGLTSSVEVELAVLGLDDTASSQMNAAFADVLDELKGLWDVSKSLAPEPVVPLVDSLLRSTRGTTRGEVFAVTTRITQGQIERLVADLQEMLPGLLMGALMEGGLPAGGLPPGGLSPGGDSPSTPPPTADRTAAGLQITGSAGMAQFPEFVDGEQVKPVELHLDLVGADAARASGYGFITLENAVDSNGTMLALNGDGLPFGTFGSGMATIDRNDFFVQHPENGCRVTVRLRPPENLPAAIATAKGTVKLFVVDESSEVIVEDVKSLLGQTINHPQLAAAGFELKLSEVTEDGETVWKIEWANPPGDYDQAQRMISGVGQGIATPELIDANGNSVGNFSTSTAGFGNSVSVEWSTAVDPDNPFPDDVRLRVKVNSRVSVVDVPFEVSDVAVSMDDQ